MILIKEANTPNANGIVYTKECLEKIVENFNDQPCPNFKGPLCGVMLGDENLVDGTKVDLNNLVMTVANLRLDENGNLVGDEKILNTNKGQHYAKLVSCGVSFSYGINGVGKLKEKQEVDFDDFRLVSIAIIPPVQSKPVHIPLGEIDER